MNATTMTKDTDTNGTANREGFLARTIEKQTSKIPSDVFLWAAGASMVASLAFEVVGMVRGTARFNGRRTPAPMASFIGMWAPSLLLLGVYNKIVKVAGSDRAHR